MLKTRALMGYSHNFQHLLDQSHRWKVIRQPGLLLAFALADRYHLLRQAKEQAEAQAKLTLESANLELEQKVRERTLALEAANRELNRLASSDSLTRIANRRRFDEQLSQTWHYHLREQLPLALILIDIDFFKQYNDSYGHQAGDECLVQVAAALAAVPQRAGDLVARYGGEEFVALLPHTELAGALKVAETMRQAVLELQLPHAKSHYGQVSLSLGVAMLLPNSQNAPQDLLAEADQALYQAKHDGRNRAQYAQPRLAVATC